MKNWNLKIEWSLSLIVQFTRLLSLRVLGSSVVWSSGVLLLNIEQSEKNTVPSRKGIDTSHLQRGLHRGGLGVGWAGRVCEDIKELEG
jgi:hypothetical protein